MPHPRACRPFAPGSPCSSATSADIYSKTSATLPYTASCARCRGTSPTACRSSPATGRWAPSFCYLPGEEIGEEEQVFLKAVADQTAVAIENARLFSEARGKAALEERQRLARAARLGLPGPLRHSPRRQDRAKLADQNPQLVADPLDYILSLADAGLAEMRALIFELRPESWRVRG